MKEVIVTIKNYQEEIIDQYNRINNLFPASKQDDETKAAVFEMKIRIEGITQLINHLNSKAFI